MKRHVTLIEMMIVMFLIALITGVIAYNYRGSLDEGKAFKTKASIQRIETVLNLAAAENSEALDGIESNWKTILEKSPLIQNPKSLQKDGWGNDFQVSAENGIIKVTSQKFEDYKKKGKTMFSDEAD